MSLGTTRSHRVADILETARFHTYFRRRKIVANTRSIVLCVDLSATVLLQNIDRRVPISISPNSEIFVCQCPVERIVSSSFCSWEILLVSLQICHKTTYHEILVVEGFKLEKVLCLHVADMFVDILNRRSFCGQNSQTHSRTNSSLCAMHQI